MVAIGIFLHAIGGLAAGSFYIPYKKVRSWSWESMWIFGGFFAWIIVPWIVAFFAVPEFKLFDLLDDVFHEIPPDTLFYTYFFGVLWGIGGVTFGLSMRYLGLSLGYATSLGFCAAFGTLMVPIYKGQFYELISTLPGLVTLSGVLLCLFGIAICGYAGVNKERELTSEEKQASIKEFSFKKGMVVAVIAGLLSACMTFGLTAGEPIAKLSIKHGTAKLWSNSTVFIIVLAGGFTTNFLWCLFLNIKNRSIKDYVNGRTSPLLFNYLFSAIAGTTWYLQFMFYGMGKTKMGDYDFASWTIHMAFIIFFSNLWGLYFREWKGVSKRTKKIIVAGIATVLLSVVVVGLGSYLKSIDK